MEDMNINSVKAKVLTAALPYIQKYNGKTVVVKYGGNAMIHPLLKKAVMSDIILLKLVGINIVLVHGGGPEISSMLERLDIPCIYVEGDAANSTQGHAWNIVELNGQYYYVDATNGDQPDFLEGDATLRAEHKTTIYDYLCPFPQEYEENYTASDEFPVPACTATDMNFYVRNGACFDTYDWSSVYDLCRLRIDSDAAVVRFKFGSQGAYDEAYMDLIDSNHIQDIAKYYMEVHGLSQISYHYGVIDNMKTLYFMF